MVDIVPVLNEGLGNSSYVVDLGDGRALVVDPERDPTPYLGQAGRRGLRIGYVAETHLHADFVSGSRELASSGAIVLAPAAGGTEFPHRGLGNGDEVDLGGLRLRGLATPGHTPEHLSYLLLDGARPLALFSGGSLLVGAVARTDLIGPDRTEELSRSLWRALHEQILTLPDDLVVFPTHGAGSFCSAPAGAERRTTIGRERLENPLLCAPDEDGFVKLLLEGLGGYPPYFLRLRAVNRHGPKVYGTPQPALRALSADDLRRLQAEGAEVVDARPVGSFAAGHIPGAISIALRDVFATWLGWICDPDRPLVLVLDEGQDRAEVVRQALNIGYEQLAGELTGGMATWRAAGLPVRSIPLVGAGHLDPARTVDVRQVDEFAAAHIPGARHVELGSLRHHAEGLPGGPLTLLCGHGERAMTAASLLEAAGRNELSVLMGGPEDWSAATGLPLKR